VTESILQEAQRLIHGERNKNYGHPRENFADIAVLFTAYLDKEIDEIDVANLMILVKVARVKGTGYHRDSFTDIAGYAGCVERIYEEPGEVPLADWERQLLDQADEPVSSDREHIASGDCWCNPDVEYVNQVSSDELLADWEKGLLQVARNPRKYPSIDKIPEGVVAGDIEGSLYRVNDGVIEFCEKGMYQWERWHGPLDDWEYGPYVEVV